MANPFERINLAPSTAPETEVLTKEQNGDSRKKEKKEARDLLNQANACGRLAFLEIRRLQELVEASKTGLSVENGERVEEMSQKLKIDRIKEQVNQVVLEAVKNSCICFGEFCLDPQGEQFGGLKEVAEYNEKIKEGELIQEPIKDPKDYVNKIKIWLIGKPLITQKLSEGDKENGYANLYSQGDESIWARQQLALAHLTGFGEAAHLLGDKETHKLVAETMQKQLEKR